MNRRWQTHRESSIMHRSLDAVRHYKPPVVILENVMGLMDRFSDEAVSPFQYLRGHLSKLGYHVAAYNLDAAPWLDSSRPRRAVGQSCKKKK